VTVSGWVMLDPQVRGAAQRIAIRRGDGVEAMSRLKPSLAQLARDALDDRGVADVDDRVGVGEAEHQDEVVAS
jgi:hypothetical protein